MKSLPVKINLLELKPKSLFPSETLDGEKVVVLVPKFQNKFFLWFMPRLSKKNFRVKLDQFGSFIWKECDGETTVQEIAERMKAKFGDTVEPVYDRIGEFMKRLQRDRLINLEKVSEIVVGQIKTK